MSREAFQRVSECSAPRLTDGENLRRRKGCLAHPCGQEHARPTDFGKYMRTSPTACAARNSAGAVPGAPL
ncbi:hypothetical protein ILT44_19955 [Microvirga sp. BT689]|uniref:hypothetical protein n=1 Tax=Microvirga arvi TaxID=2778731 RepID=UPI00195096CA|nr:hypothetical protein [Microvirga arvi]MBM6582483.1 hypothetical protein [Microvirga arvi]